MKRTMTMITAAMFAGAMALPAFAQVGAGIAGNANVGHSSMRGGANGDVGNGDAERTEPNAPANTTSAASRRQNRRMNSAPAASNGAYSNNGAGANAGARANGGLGSGLGANVGVGGLGANVGAGANAGRNNSPTGGY
jgi:hypothetical protein